MIDLLIKHEHNHKSFYNNLFLLLFVTLLMIAFKKGFTISTKLFNSKLPLIQLVNFIQPVGLGWANYDTNQLILTPKYHFANNQKPHSQHPGK